MWTRRRLVEAKLYGTKSTLKYWIIMTRIFNIRYEKEARTHRLVHDLKLLF